MKISHKIQNATNSSLLLIGYRERYMFTQSYVAHQLGVSKMTISRWERGINEMSRKSSFNLSKLIITESAIKCPYCKKEFHI